MIKVSTKGRYGTRLMLNLANHYKTDQKPIILKNIADDEDLSIRYLEQIIIPLKLSKLVKSVRGAGGGYVLAKPPSEIKLHDIIQTLEGPICLVDCVDDSDYCDRIPFCTAHEIWKEATYTLRDYFQKKTLHQLVKISNKKRAT
ncbi:MAG: Rrf2 family transcriptional regulator [Candidatus Aminicenantaceae bacterium]